MKRIFCVLFGLIVLFPCFLKAQKGKIIWERGGQIGNQIQGDIPFSPDSSEFGLYSHLASGFEIRSSNTGAVLRIIPKINSGTMAWSPKGDFIAVYDREYIQGTNNTIGVLSLLDPKDGTILKMIKPYEGSLEFSPDGNYLVTQRNEYESLIVKIEDTIFTAIQFPWVRYIILPGDTTALVFKNDSLLKVSFPQGNILMYYSDISPLSASDFSGIVLHKSTGKMAVPYDYLRKLVIADVGTGAVLKNYADTDYYRNQAFTFTPDGNSLAIGGDDFSLLDLISDTVITIANYEFRNDGQIYFNNTGKALLLAAAPGGDCYPTNFDRMWRDNSLRIWDMDKNERVIIKGMGHDTYIRSFKISEDNNTVYSVDWDSTALTWNIENGELLKQEQVTLPAPDSGNGDIISPSGKYRLKTYPGSFELWDNQTNTLLHNLPYKTQSAPYTYVFGRTFSADEKHILASLEYEYIGWSGHDFPRQELYFWSTETGQKTDSIPLPCFLSGIQVSNNNAYIVGATFDRRIIAIGAQGLLTSVENSQPENLLKTTIYPNPLHETGIISYSISNPGLLKISVHDIFGREMMVLKNEFSEPGKFTIPFKSGELSSGMYFLKVMSGEEVTTTHFGILR